MSDQVNPSQVNQFGDWYRSRWNLHAHEVLRHTHSEPDDRIPDATYCDALTLDRTGERLKRLVADASSSAVLETGILGSTTARD